ncbi:hypothetical protein BDM02DRAFT_3074706, partial [Thelephora ganbajun]
QGIAKVHSHVSNRAKNKQTLERKPAFKPCLSNPFEIDWPSVPINVQNAVLSRLILSLEGVAAYRASKTAQSREKKRQCSQQSGPNKRRKIHSGNEDGTSDPIAPPVGASTSSDEPMVPEGADQESAIPTEPPIIPHLILGINQVAKRLEHQARAYRQTLSVTKAVTDGGTSQPPPSGPISIVFVCRADVDPPLLISHLPTLIASCNSSRNALTDPESYPPIKLVPIPKGSESLLADATGLRRLAVLALDNATPDLEAFQSLLDSVPVLRASWLSQPEHTSNSNPGKLGAFLVPTHIKQLRTTVPKDMKAAKEQRTKGRAEAKRRKK